MRTRSLPFGHPGCLTTGRKVGPFIDTGNAVMIQNRRWPVLVSEVGAGLLAKHIGWISPQEADDLREEAIALKHRISQLEDENDGLNRELDGFDGLMKRGYVPKRASGRPPKKAPKEGEDG